MSFDITLRLIETVRESDGLALSSRNRRLNSEDREKSILLFNSLEKAKKLITEGKSIAETKDVIINDFKNVENVELEYIEFSDPQTLEPIIEIKGYSDAVICIAGYVGNVRLIDNTFLNL